MLTIPKSNACFMIVYPHYLWYSLLFPIWVCLKIVYPIFPMVLLIIIPTKWLFHWGYTPFSEFPHLANRWQLGCHQGYGPESHRPASALRPLWPPRFPVGGGRAGARRWVVGGALFFRNDPQGWNMMKLQNFSKKSRIWVRDWSPFRIINKNI